MELTPLQSELAATGFGLACGMARSSGGDPDEMLSDACLALVEAAPAWREGGGARFTSYAFLRVSSRLAMALKRRSARQAMERPMVSDFASHDPPVGHLVDARDEVEHWLGRLPASHAAIMRRIHVDGASVDEVASDMNVSDKYIYKINAQSVEKLRRLAHRRRGEE